MSFMHSLAIYYCGLRAQSQLYHAIHAGTLDISFHGLTWKKKYHKYVVLTAKKCFWWIILSCDNTVKNGSSESNKKHRWVIALFADGGAVIDLVLSYTCKHTRHFCCKRPPGKHLKLLNINMSKYDEMTLKELRGELRRKHARISGRKKELIER